MRMDTVSGFEKFTPVKLEKFHWDCSAVPPQKRFAKIACADLGLKSLPSLLQTAAGLPGLRVLNWTAPPPLHDSGLLQGRS